MARFAGERGTQEGDRAFERRLGADDACPESEDVHVVVLDALVGRVGVVANGGADAPNLVGCHGGSDARPADEDPAIDLTITDGMTETSGEIRIVVIRV